MLSPPRSLEGVHLLFDDVGAFAHRADEQVGVLKSRRVDAGIPEAVGYILGLRLDVAPILLLFRQPVSGAPWRAKNGQVPSTADLMASVSIILFRDGASQLVGRAAPRIGRQVVSGPLLDGSSAGQAWIV